MPTIISIENLWKEYRLGVIGHGTLTHDLQAWWAKLRGKEDPNSLINNASPDCKAQVDGNRFLALQNINLEVKEGEVLGIIGKNGAGKSTLLKILSRVTAPTGGTIKVKGRIASLLEVGTGFHPELTGRENVFLNGAILGMSKDEVRKKLEEIIYFSGVEQHIDTPVKRYSSGMYVRLAFAVAAHLEPEILVVDEVLAVGDIEFQKKCLGKMKEVSHTGRTVLFVSHNMAAVNNLCDHGILLQNGTVHSRGTQSEVIDKYLQNQSSLSATALVDRLDRSGSGSIQVQSIELKDEKGNPLENVACGQSFSIHLRYIRHGHVPATRLCVSIMLKTLHDVPVFQHHNRLTDDLFESIPPEGEFILKLTKFPLTAAVYRLTFAVMLDAEFLDHLQDAIELNVIGGDFYGTGKSSPSGHGVFLIPGKWHISGLVKSPE